MGVWLFCCNFRPLVRLLITLHPFVRRTPFGLDDDAWPSTLQCSDVLPCLESVLLAGVRFLRGHPSDGSLGVGKDCDSL